MCSAKAVFGKCSSEQMQGLQLYLKQTPTQVFSYEIYKIFKNNFFYRTSLLWWLRLAVNCVNQWKHTLKVYAVEKEMIYLNGISKVSVSRSREGIYLTFSKHCWQCPILVKLQLQRCSVRHVFLKISQTTVAFL